MSITMHTALYQKWDETSQGVANFKTSVFHSRSFRPIARPGYGKSALSALEVEITLCDPKGFEIDLSMRGIVKGVTRTDRSNTPPGTVLAPFWLPESIEKFIKKYIDFLNDFMLILAPFSTDFEAILMSF